MITQKGNKKMYNPITTDGKTSVVMWDYRPFLDENGNEIERGKWQVEKLVGDISLDRIKTVILDYYNSKIDEKIVSGMVWKNMKIWLSHENQFNYKAAYDLAIQTGGKNLPVVFKFGENNVPQYYEFETVEDLSDFYLSSMQHIQQTLEEGWRLKDSIDWTIYQID